MRHALPGRSSPRSFIAEYLIAFSETVCYTPGRVACEPQYHIVDDRRLTTTRLFPLMNKEYEIPVWVGMAMPKAQTADSRSLQEIRAALRLISRSDGVLNCLSAKDRKSHYIFQSMVSYILNNLRRTADHVRQQSRAVDLPNSNDFSIVMATMYDIMMHVVDMASREIRRKVGTPVFPLVSEADDLLINAPGLSGRSRLVTKLPKSLSLARQTPSRFERTMRVDLAAMRESVKGLHVKCAEVITNIQWFNDLDVAADTSRDQVFMSQLGQVLQDIDKLSKLTRINLKQLRDAKETKNMLNFEVYRGVRQQANSQAISGMEKSELAKLHSLFDKSENVEALEESWQQLFLLLRNKSNDLTLSHLELIENHAALQDIQRLSSFADLEGLIGMEAASISAYAQLRCWMSILTKPGPILKEMLASLDGHAASSLTHAPSIYKYYSDRVLASFCANLEPESVRVIADMFKNDKYVDVDLFERCHESPVAWLGKREYLFKRSEASCEAQFESIHVDPLWRQRKKIQRDIMTRLDENKRKDLILKETAIAESCF